MNKNNIEQKDEKRRVTDLERTPPKVCSRHCPSPTREHPQRHTPRKRLTAQPARITHRRHQRALSLSMQRPRPAPAAAPRAARARLRSRSAQVAARGSRIGSQRIGLQRIGLQRIGLQRMLPQSAFNAETHQLAFDPPPPRRQMQRRVQARVRALFVDRAAGDGPVDAGACANLEGRGRRGVRRGQVFGMRR
jgi:hypothetical protein